MQIKLPTQTVSVHQFHRHRRKGEREKMKLCIRMIFNNHNQALGHEFNKVSQASSVNLSINTEIKGQGVVNNIR